MGVFLTEILYLLAADLKEAGKYYIDISFWKKKNLFSKLNCSGNTGVNRIKRNSYIAV